MSEFKARAKLNIHLAVLNRRNDGFHSINSVMAPVELHDRILMDDLHVGKKDSGSVQVRIRSMGGNFPDLIDSIPEDKNLMYLALAGYARHAGITLGASIGIEKNIPAGAGMGGGSSNAAAVLLLVNQRLGFLDDKALLEVAASVGSDVPFFLSSSWAVVRGRGEMIVPFEADLDAFVLLVNNGIHIDTPGAYRSLKRDTRVPDKMQIPSDRELMDCVCSADFERWKDFFYNDFEKPIFSEHNSIKLIKDELYALGSDFALMTGSGSTVFGIFINEKKAVQAKKVLAGRGGIVILTKFVRGLFLKQKGQV